MNLQDYNAHDLIHALSLAQSEPSKGELRKGLLTELERANQVVAETDFRVSVFLPQATIINNRESRKRIFKKRIDASAEVYVVSLALDLSGIEGESLRVGNVTAEKEAVIGLPKGVDKQIFSNITRTASKGFVVNSTPIFHDIYDRDSLPLLGNGIRLYGPRDPKGFLELHVAIMEDDNAYRNLGKFVEETAQAIGIQKLILEATQAVSISNPVVGLLSNAFGELFNSVLNRMKNNEDDVIQQLHFSSIAHQGYREGIIPFERSGASGHLEVVVHKKLKS